MGVIHSGHYSPLSFVEISHKRVEFPRGLLFGVVSTKGSARIKLAMNCNFQ